MSYYVKRTSKSSPVGFSYVGPIRSESQAEKERDAWLAAGESAEILLSTSAVRNRVRAHAKAVSAPDAREMVWYQDEQMTMASYRLLNA